MQKQALQNSYNQGILSLSGSIDLDSFEIEDEVATVQDAGRKMYALQESPPNVGDSLDLENSDDLNKIISRYETMLS
jgi:hypothetical protein